MRVYELIELLEELDPNMEIKIAYQPHWPMQAAIGDVKDAEGTVYICQVDPANDYAPQGLYEV